MQRRGVLCDVDAPVCWNQGAFETRVLAMQLQREAQGGILLILTAPCVPWVFLQAACNARAESAVLLIANVSLQKKSCFVDSKVLCVHIVLVPSA